MTLAEAVLYSLTLITTIDNKMTLVEAVMYTLTLITTNGKGQDDTGRGCYVLYSVQYSLTLITTIGYRKDDTGRGCSVLFDPDHNHWKEKRCLTGHIV